MTGGLTGGRGGDPTYCVRRSLNVCPCLRLPPFEILGGGERTFSLLRVGAGKGGDGDKVEVELGEKGGRAKTG